MVADIAIGKIKMKANIFLVAVLFIGLAHSLVAKVPDLTATVASVFDGDTFGATVHLENGASVFVNVRIMNIDAPEMNGECQYEKELAERAKNRLTELLPRDSTVTLSKIKDDKYLKRIDALTLLANGDDVGKIMVREKLAVYYNGGKRQPWCKN